MSHLNRNLLSLGVTATILLAGVSCRAGEDDITVATIAPNASVTPTQLLIEKEGDPEAIPSPLPMDNSSNRNHLPDGWKLAGDARLGLQIGVPQEWVDFSSELRAVANREQVGLRSLFLADSSATASAFIAGESIGNGAYILASSIDGYALTMSSVSAFEALSQTSLALGPLDPLSVDTQPLNSEVDYFGFYFDHEMAGFGSLLAQKESLMGRIALVQNPLSPSAAYFLMASDQDSWNGFEPLFDQMVGTIVHHERAASSVEPLANGQVSSSSIDQGQYDLWVVGGEKGSYGLLRAQPSNESSDLIMTLISPSGRPVISVDNGYGGDSELLIDWLFAESGSYQVEVREFFHEPMTYTIEYQLSGEPQYQGGGALDIGAEASAELQPNGIDDWTFEGSAGGIVSFIITPLKDDLDLKMELVGPDGHELADLDEGFAGDAEVLAGFELPLTGIYRLRVYSFAGNSGTYRVSLSEGAESVMNFHDAGDLLPRVRSRELLHENEAHAWFVDSSAGQVVNLLVTPIGESLDLELWLLSPDLLELARVDDRLTDEQENINYVIRESGNYIVLVREFFGEAGEYELSLRFGAEEAERELGAISAGQSQSATLGPRSSARWTFAALQGASYLIEVLPTGELADLVITLLDPDGEEVAIGDSTLAGEPEALTVRVTEAGQWSLLVHEFFGLAAEFTVTLTEI